MLEHLVELLEHLQEIVHDMHGLGIFVFAGVFVVAQMLMIPVAPLASSAASPAKP